MIGVEDYRRVAPPGVVDIILKLSERVRGRRLLHLSAGRFGGGAAEILQTLVPIMADLGVEAVWEITGGDPAFYATATALEASLRGTERVLTDEASLGADGFEALAGREPPPEFGALDDLLEAEGAGGAGAAGPAGKLIAQLLGQTS